MPRAGTYTRLRQFREEHGFSQATFLLIERRLRERLAAEKRPERLDPLLRVAARLMAITTGVRLARTRELLGGLKQQDTVPVAPQMPVDDSPLAFADWTASEREPDTEQPDEPA